MADINPVSTTLPDAKEFVDITQTFTPNLLADESIVSISITKVSEANKGISVNGATYSGQYQDVFILKNALKYRQGDELKTASSFNDLPPGVDVYDFKAPSSARKDYTYEVTMVYLKHPPAVTPPPPVPTPPVEMSMKKTFTQSLYGDWSIWANQLRTYLGRTD